MYICISFPCLPLLFRFVRVAASFQALPLVRIGVGLGQAQVLGQDVRGQRPAVERIRRPGWTYIENGFFHRRVVVVLGRTVRLGTTVAVTGTARVRAGRAEQTGRESGVPRR